MKKISSFLLVVVFVLVLYFGGLSYQMSMNALMIWFEKLVPSMFCVMVLVKVLFEQGVLTYVAYPFGYLFSSLLRIEKKSFAYVFACIFLGFPAGANFINEQVQAGNLREKEGQRLICACSFATPGFVILTCGALLFESITIGLTLFLIQVTTGFILLLFTRCQRIEGQIQTQEIPSFMTSLSRAILQSGKTLYIIGGYLMLFMSIAAILTQFFPPFLQLFLRIISEFSSGTLLLCEQPLSRHYLLIGVSMVLSFGGLCVHMQVMSMSKDTGLRYTKYLHYRILQVCLSALLAYLIFS